MKIDYDAVTRAIQKAFSNAESNWRTPKGNLLKVDGVVLVMQSLADEFRKESSTFDVENFFRHCEYGVTWIVRQRRIKREDRRARKAKGPKKKVKVKIMPFEPVTHERTIRREIK